MFIEFIYITEAKLARKQGITVDNNVQNKEMEIGKQY